MPLLAIPPIDLTNRELNRLTTKFIEKLNVKIREENVARTARNAANPTGPQEPMQVEWSAETYTHSIISAAVKDWVTKDRDEEAATLSELYKAANDQKRAAALAALQ